MDSIDHRPDVGGYDAVFINPLQSDYECPICQCAFRDPVQIEECGHRFCLSCINEIKKQKGTLKCPLDRQLINIEKMFLDKAVKRAILSLIVKCHNFSRNCEWTGELGFIEEHVKSCPYENIVCPNELCQDLFPRGTLSQHLEQRCKFRSVFCQFCSEKYIHKDVKSHLKHCKKFPMECVNKCEKKDIPREKMASHLEECPFSIALCPFSEIGCEFSGKKDVLENHVTLAVNDHLSLAMTKLLIHECRFVCTNGIFVWAVPNFRVQFEAAKISEEDKAVYSHPFYTAQYGYKLRIKVYLNGRDRGKGTHISLYLIIMKGDYDNLLDWPFNHKITFYLLDQSVHRKHKVHQLSPNRSLPNVRAVFNQPTSKENLGIGNPSFVSHESMIAGGYIKDDTLFIKCEIEPVNNNIK
ncbi:TNF receptor-associated factor 5 isoform X2 [Hydra vulgaris]|uniref:TNF receptor-associated factor 4 n=2 Tax=Hydra vulgaris TaxID=6087 RepID=T2M6V6_HYDVU|nr:TNF receptor-associated factor 5 isoform X2 [Hydra vulgaris]